MSHTGFGHFDPWAIWGVILLATTVRSGRNTRLALANDVTFLTALPWLAKEIYLVSLVPSLKHRLHHATIRLWTFVRKPGKQTGQTDASRGPH